MSTPVGANANVVFEMAIVMEKTGKNFYEALALGSDDGAVREFCRRTAGQEAAHMSAFQQMRNQWAETIRAKPPRPELSEALASLVKGRIQPDPTAVHKVAIGGNLTDALNMAVKMEQDAVAFYQEMSARLPDSASAIQQIVDEEKKHLVGLKMLAL